MQFQADRTFLENGIGNHRAVKLEVFVDTMW